MPLGGVAQVTAYGTASRRCAVLAIETVAVPQRVAIRCLDLAGHPADARFTLTYER
jgi:hypothetical protein